MNRRRKTILINSLFVVILISTITGCNENTKKKNITEPVKVRTTKAVLKEVSPVIHSSGTLSSQSEMKLSFKTGGIINKILVNDGQTVKKGQVLAQLNLAEIQAYSNQARLGFEKAQRDFERAENLYKDSVATLEQYQNAKTQLEIAKNNVQISNFNLKYSTITAPANGKILTCMNQENEVIGAGFPVFLFGANQNNWIVKTNITDKDIIKLQTGDSAIVLFDAYPAEKFKAQISEISGTADPYTGTYGVELLLETTRLSLSSGFIAKLDITSSQKKRVMSIPYQAITDADGLSGNIFLIENGNPVKKKVKIYSINNEEVLIEPEINTDAPIITDGVNYLKKNSTIKIQN